jgi:hypothetical protein
MFVMLALEWEVFVSTVKYYQTQALEQMCILPTDNHNWMIPHKNHYYKNNLMPVQMQGKKAVLRESKPGIFFRQTGLS